jgi:hypothetical protein
MSFYKLGDSFRWFIGRVADIKDPKRMGRVKVRVIHDQTGELGKQANNFGITDEDLLWAYPISAIQSASLHWKKIKEDELEGFDIPDWIDAVGLSPTGIAVGTYVYGFYLDGHEQNIPLIFGTYHKMSRYPEPPTDLTTGKMLQIANPAEEKFYNDVAALAQGNYFDEETQTQVDGQSLPKTPYSKNKLVDEPKSAYNAEYPYNTTYTTKSGHAVELDDTPSHERVHVWHNSGSYEEIANIPESDNQREVKGRRVKRTKDDSFDIVDRNRNEYVGNNHTLEIANNQLVFVGNNQTVIVGANCTISVGNNCNLIVGGHINIIAAEGISINAGGAGITVNRGPLHVVDALSTATGETGHFTAPDGKLIVVEGGIITRIVESI